MGNKMKNTETEIDICHKAALVSAAYDRALADYDRALADYDRAWAAYNRAGSAYKRAGSAYDRALADYDRALSACPDRAAISKATAQEP
jgi:tetratricopeptide (TPR) repeat protein